MRIIRVQSGKCQKAVIRTTKLILFTIFVTFLLFIFKPDMFIGSYRKPAMFVNFAYDNDYNLFDDSYYQDLSKGKVRIDNTILGNKLTVGSMSSELKQSDGTKPKIPNKTMKVILVAQPRSGSSYIGSILQRRPRTFYLYEPLRLLKFTDVPNNFTDNILLGSEVSMFLRNLLDCNFYHIINASLKYAPDMDEGRKIWLPIAFPNFINIEGAMHDCLSRHHVIIKCIRINYLKHVIPSLTDQLVTIVHLIRDPRGQVSSLLQLKLDELHIPSPSSALYKEVIQEYVRTQAKRYCQQTTANYNYMIALKQSGYDFTNRYVTIRYEDFALYPTTMATKLLSYFGDVPSEDFMDWLQHITSTDLKNEPYIPIRNSTNAAKAWRTLLPYHLVQIIQEHCKNVLMQYGYILVSSQEQLVDFSYDLVNNSPKFISVL